MPVVGLTAVGFSPVDDVLASIGSPRPVEASPGIPLGPLRLLDARTGEVRTLLDGEVITFDWSPDGKTIAAIRVVPIDAARPERQPGLVRRESQPRPVGVARCDHRDPPRLRGRRHRAAPLRP